MRRPLAVHRTTALITGGQGYIGSFLSRGLVEERFVVRTLDRSPDMSIASERLMPLRGSILDTDFLRSAMDGVEIVFHLAGVGSPGSPREAERCMADTNIAGTLSVLQAAASVGVSRVVMTSTAAVYGSVPEDPKREDMAVQPENAYAVTKLAAEHMCRVYHARYGVETVVARLFNVYGPHYERQSQRSLLIPSIVRSLKERGTIQIRGDGAQTRDFIYVGDVVKALLRCGSARDAAGEVINVGTGQAVTILDVAAEVASILKIEPRVVRQSEESAGVQSATADSRKAQQILGWTSETSLHEGLRRSLLGGECRMRHGGADLQPMPQ